jgi:hypothetical protein
MAGIEIISRSAGDPAVAWRGWRRIMTHTHTHSGRVTVVPPGGKARTEYLANANPRVMALQRHLYRGRFLRDFPTCAEGDVPPKAWKIGEFREAMRTVELVY